VSNDNNIRKLQGALLLPTIALGVSVAYMLSYASLMRVLESIFGQLASPVTIAFATVLPLASCALSMFLTSKARNEVAAHVGSANREESILARNTSTYSKLINITAIVVAAIICLVSGIASAIATANVLGSSDGSQLTFLISFVLGLVVIYLGIRTVSQLKSSDAAPQPAASAPVEAHEATASAEESTAARVPSKSSAVNAMIIPVFAFVLVPVIATQILSTTKGEGIQWVTYGSLIAVAASLFVGARLLASTSHVRDQNGKLAGGVTLARQWIFGLNFVNLAIAGQILWAISISLGLSGAFGQDTPSFVDLLINLIMPIVVLAAMFAAHHFVLIYRAKTPQK
jgi:large-conductance mechanosensitive channel